MQFYSSVLLEMDEDYIRKLCRDDPEDLIKLSLRLIDDLKRALEFENQSPNNSSKPPSSQAPWDRNDDASEEDDDHDLHDKSSESSEPTDKDHSKDSGENQPSDPSKASSSKKKAGKPHGGQGFGRMQKLPITDQVEHRLSYCEGCGHDLTDAQQTSFTGFYSIDVIFGDSQNPGLSMTNTLHRSPLHMPSLRVVNTKFTQKSRA